MFRKDKEIIELKKEFHEMYEKRYAEGYEKGLELGYEKGFKDGFWFQIENIEIGDEAVLSNGKHVIISKELYPDYDKQELFVNVTDGNTVYQVALKDIRLLGKNLSKIKELLKNF